MSEITEKEQETMNAGRSLRAESTFLLPLLQTKKELVCGKIIQAFKAGAQDAVWSHAAELSTLYDMRTEITRKIKAAEAIEKRIFEGDET